MQRREFLSLAGRAGVFIAPWALIPEAQAQSYSGRILVNIHADGGLDQSSWTDPRESDRAINSYAAAGTPAGVAGNIRFAPMGNNAAFFNAHFRNMLVINGVHSETNDHGGGARAHATGRLDAGYPNVAELHAATYGKGLPMAWLNAGGFRTSAGLMPATPVPDANAFRALSQPNAASATNDFMKQADVTRTQAVRAERMKALMARGDVLPRSKIAMQEFIDAADSRALLARVAQVTPATFDTFTQAHIALVAGLAGLTTTVQLSTGGFDTHSNHDNSMTNALPRLTNLVDYIWQKSAELGIANRLFVRIYSEFGRTALNSGNGKDHHEVGSQILMEANAPWGNRVFGLSGPKHQGLKISPSTAKEDAAGFVLKPRHIHAAMRKYLGIETTDPRFNLKVPAAEMFDLFNPALSTGYVTM
ncbi:MAG: DUF1501 domain-containing protein [Burkholderiales bacterium]|nr:DUF1501 domain-containing protein [Burkholderiales bacterium]